MLTQDILIPKVPDWVAIPCINEVLVIHNSSTQIIKMKLGTGSTSEGFIVTAGSTILVDELAYLQSGPMKAVKIEVTQ